jgi:hypothetical protein
MPAVAAPSLVAASAAPAVAASATSTTVAVPPTSPGVTAAGVAMIGSSESQQMAVRERKYGEFLRTFAVPPETKVRIIRVLSLSFFSLSCSLFCLPFFLPSFLARPCRFCMNSTGLFPSLLVSSFCQPEDIDAQLEDGLLILKIKFPSPAESDDRHYISVR